MGSTVLARAKPKSFTERGKTDVTRKAKKTVGMRRAAAAKTSTEKSSGNVFADLGVLHPEQELLKAKLTLQIYGLIKQRGIKQTADIRQRAGPPMPPATTPKLPAIDFS